MELLIKIPKEFEQHFKQDAFEDSLHRLSADAHLIAGIYEQETAKMLRDVFKSAVPIPPHRRLGDLDRLEQMFVDIDNAPYSGFDGTEPFYSAEDAAQIIRLAPTVIPASEEG